MMDSIAPARWGWMDGRMTNGYVIDEEAVLGEYNPASRDAGTFNPSTYGHGYVWERQRDNGGGEE